MPQLMKEDEAPGHRRLKSWPTVINTDARLISKQNAMIWTDNRLLVSIKTDENFFFLPPPLFQKMAV